MSITNQTTLEPIIRSGQQIQSKNSNGIMIDNNNGGGVSVIINNVWVIPPGVAKPILFTDVRIKDQTNYVATFDTANTFGLNTSAVEQAIAVMSFLDIKCD